MAEHAKLMNIAITISVLALLFTIMSFWWMNWRTGRLHVGSPRAYAAHGANEGALIIELPLVFYNSGAVPMVVQNLRLSVLNEQDTRPLIFTATVDKLGTDDGRELASQFPVPANAAIKLICEFQRRPGKLLFQAGSYPMRLDGVLNSEKRWQPLCSFDLNVTEQAENSINRLFITYENWVYD